MTVGFRGQLMKTYTVFNLNAFRRLLYCTGYWNKYVADSCIFDGLDVLRVGQGSNLHTLYWDSLFWHSAHNLRAGEVREMSISRQTLPEGGNVKPQSERSIGRIDLLNMKWSKCNVLLTLIFYFFFFFSASVGSWAIGLTSSIKNGSWDWKYNPFEIHSRPKCSA